MAKGKRYNPRSRRKSNFVPASQVKIESIEKPMYCGRMETHEATRNLMELTRSASEEHTRSRHLLFLSFQITQITVRKADFRMTLPLVPPTQPPPSNEKAT